MLDNLLSIISGLLFGIIISLIIRVKMTKYHGADSNIVRRTIYRFGENCYQFTPIIVQCNENK